MKNNYSPDILNCLANLSSDEVFTSPELANRMLDLLPQELFRSSKTRFLDPCSKSGVFLREIAKRLLAGLEEQFPDLQQRIDHIMTQQVFGIACTDLTAEMSRRTLYCTKQANGEYSVATCFDDTQGNLRYIRCQHTWENGKCKHCGANRAQYDRVETIETYAYPFIHKDINEIFKNMQFDVIIGNPPYQMGDGGNGASALPVYHKFIEQTIELKPKYMIFIVPARWLNGGRGLDDFRKKMLEDSKIRVLHDYLNSTDCFSGVEIKGGVCYFLWEKDYKGICSVYTHNQDNVYHSERPLLENGAEIFIRSEEQVTIFHKVLAKQELKLKGKYSQLMVKRSIQLERLEMTYSLQKCMFMAGNVGFRPKLYQGMPIESLHIRYLFQDREILDLEIQLLVNQKYQNLTLVVLIHTWLLFLHKVICLLVKQQIFVHI